MIKTASLPITASLRDKAAQVSYSIRHRWFGCTTDALRILGYRFISPHELSRGMNLPRYSSDVLDYLYETMPNVGQLHALRINNYVLMPGAPSDGLCIQNNGYDTQFPVPYGKWIAIRSSPIPWSSERTWEEQLGMLQGHESVPDAGTLSFAWSVLLQTRARHQLWDYSFARTSLLEQPRVCSPFTVGPSENRLAVHVDNSHVRDILGKRRHGIASMIESYCFQTNSRRGLLCPQ